MTLIQKIRRRTIWLSCVLLGFGATSFCFGQENEPFSYTTMPTEIIVAFTNVRSDNKWKTIIDMVEANKKPYQCNMVRVDFKEYLKDVVSHEWNRKHGKDEALDFLKAGAVAAKTKAWEIRNYRHPSKKTREYEGLLEDKNKKISGPPDIQSSIFDQVYIRSDCTGQDTPECMGETWHGTPIVAQAVDETFEAILKRHDCYYEYGHPTNYGGKYKKLCPNVFETNYNTSIAGCKEGDLWLSYSCIPQEEGRSGMKQDQLTWTEMLAYYYGARPDYKNHEELTEKLRTAPVSLYEWKADDLAVNSTVETLNTCMTILYELNGNEKIPQYGCKNRDDTVIKKIHYLNGNGFPHPCQDEKGDCPLGDHYIDVGMKGILLEVKPNARQETWFKVKWIVTSGKEASDDQSELAHAIIGWSPDTDIKPASAMSLVEVHIIGARLKAYA